MPSASRLFLVVFIIALSLRSNPACAQIVITGDPRDRVVTSNGTLQDFTQMRVGFSGSAPVGGRNAVYVFALPTLAPGESIASANVDLFLNSKTVVGGINYNADLYGLGFRNAAAGVQVVSGTDYFEGPGPDATDATLIQDNFATLASPNAAFLSTDAMGDANLASYINAQYAAGATTGLTGTESSFIVLRLNPDNTTTTGSGYEFASADPGVAAANRPVLSLTVVPEPGTLALAASCLLPLGALLLRKRRQRKA